MEGCGNRRVIQVPISLPKFVMVEYLTAWIQDDEKVHLPNKFANDLSDIIYPHLAAYRVLNDAGVEIAEEYIVKLRSMEMTTDKATG